MCRGGGRGGLWWGSGQLGRMDLARWPTEGEGLQERLREVGWPGEGPRRLCPWPPGKGTVSTTTHPRFPVPARAQGPWRGWEKRQRSRAACGKMDTGCGHRCRNPATTWLPASPLFLPSQPHRHCGRQVAPGEGRGLEQDKTLVLRAVNRLQLAGEGG